MLLYQYSILSCLAYASLSTCAYVRFEVDLTQEVRAPDGQSRNVILTNGQLPGPQLNLNFGDDVEVSKKLESVAVFELTQPQFIVNNNLPYVTAIHFHGIEYVENKLSRQFIGKG